MHIIIVIVIITVSVIIFKPTSTKPQVVKKLQKNSEKMTVIPAGSP